jgi:hypothetical protein
VCMSGDVLVVVGRVCSESDLCGDECMMSA